MKKKILRAFVPKNLRQRKLYFVLQFLIRLLLFTIPFFIITLLNLYYFQIFTAYLASMFISSLGWHVQQDGTILIINGFRFLIDSDCTSWKLLLFYFALVFSVPKIENKWRLFGLIGIPLLIFGNIVRIASVATIRIFFGEAIAFSIHDIFWQFGLIFMAFCLWLIWFFSIRTKIRLEKIGE